MPGFGDREPPEGDGGSPEGDLLDRLAELTTRHQTGALSDAEYAAEKDLFAHRGVSPTVMRAASLSGSSAWRS